MDQYIKTNLRKNDDQHLAIDRSKIDNQVLNRLIGEIDFDRENRVSSYNRTHNRHNRGR